MKRKIFIKGLAGLVVSAMIIPSLSSCKEDYLEQSPITSTSAADIAGSIDGARAAKTGLCQGMYRQFTGHNLNSTNGEPWMMIYYGEVFGNSLLSNLYCGHGTAVQYAKWDQLRQETYWGAQQMWYYAYNLISWANMIIENIDNLDANGGERDFIKAVALSIRAHCYIHLVQVHAPNWENSDNGNVKCLILRTKSSTEELPFDTMGNVLDLIYSDLKEAITLFDNCGWERSFIWEPDGSVARGLLARAAAIKHDYPLAEQMAREAREGYEIMSAEEYNSGFVKANDEYMWATMFEAPAASLYYYATGSTNACNGRYQSSWGYTVNSIDYTLYKKFPMTDVRKGLYLTPEMLDLNQDLVDKINADIDASNAKLEDPSKRVDHLSRDDFFNADKVYTNGMRIQVNNLNPAMSKFIIAYGKQEFNRLKPINDFLSGTIAAYQKTSTEVQFGAQYKFWGNEVYGMNQWPFMRASEMGYLEAEMAYRNGNEARAREIMVELNKDVRDPEFTCTASGEELLQTIKDYRSFELWGEGFNWFDMKRWHDPIVRVGWEAGNPNSGNRGTGFTQTFNPDDFYGWVVVVPTTEFNYNKKAQRSDLPGSNR